MKVVIVAACAGLALAACSRGGDPAEAPNATGGDTSVAAVADAADFPRQRPGLWRVSTTMQGLPAPQTTDICITPEDTAAALAMSPETTRGCAETTIRRDGDAWMTNTVCGEGETRSEISSRVTGDFQSSMNAVMEMRTGGAVTMRMTSSGTYVGPCPAA